MQINPFPNKPWILRVCITSLLRTLLEKEKLLVRSNFSFSHSVFYLFGELSAIFIKSEIVVCKLSVWKSLKCVVWELVKIVCQILCSLTGACDVHISRASDIFQDFQDDPWSKIWWVIFWNDWPKHIESNKIYTYIRTCNVMGTILVSDEVVQKHNNCT